jgi:CMP-N,N'-diacetyllegionaminic acid synthase
MTNKIIALIPARGGSKRVPGKNIRMLGGKPLLAWSIETAKKLNLFTVVSSDSDEVLKIANQIYFVDIHKRSPAAAADGATDENVFKDVLSKYPSEMIVYLRPTTPFRDVEVVRRAITVMESLPGERALRSVYEMSESAYKCAVIKGNYLRGVFLKGIKNLNLPNSNCHVTYRPNGYVDIIRGDTWGDKILGFITPRVPEIDTEEDFEFAEWWAERRKK